MRITPGNSWFWSYRCMDDGEDYLGLNMTLDDGRTYFFRTNFKIGTLDKFPEFGDPFCILDARLLSDFIEGLEAIGVRNDDSREVMSMNMELALNAVACTRFVAAPPRVIENAFLPYNGRLTTEVARGMVVSLYTKDRKVYDFIVLDDESEIKDDVFRLMLVNRAFHIGSSLLSVGAMIRVRKRVICPFRGMSRSAKDGCYA